MDEGTSLQVDQTLALYSLLAFAAFAAVIVGAIVLWLRGKPGVPAALLTCTLLYRLAARPLLALVSAIMLAALIISIAIRRPAIEAE
jgi:hypothetical protein